MSLTRTHPDTATRSASSPGAGNRRGAPARNRMLRRPRLATVVLTLVTVPLAAFWLLPLAWAVLTSIKPEGETTDIPLSWLPQEPTLAAYGKVLAAGNIGQWMFNSLFTALVTTALVVLLSAMAAYGFARTEFPGRRALFGITLAGIMVPPQVLIVPLFTEMSALRLVDTYWGVILPQIVLPAMVYILVKFFQGLPIELEQAAVVDGASKWRIFWQIVLPLSRPILAAVAIFTFITTWNNFLWPFIVTTDPQMMTLPVGLTSVQSSYGLRYAQVMASAVLAALPLLVIFMLFQRQIVRGIADTGISGK